MSRLGSWEPATVDERLGRLESIAEIRQLVERYGVAVDSRDMDLLVSLFVPDVQVGKERRGRAALRAYFTDMLRAHGASVHLVGNHVIDFADADTATGIVYCRDEIGAREGDRWEVGILQYWDDYVRVDGEWCFRRRRLHRLYRVDALTRPQRGAGFGGTTMTTHLLPDAYPSWERFWTEVGVPDAESR